MLTGNKGEWSEIYVLLRLLAEGRLYAADEKVQRIESTYFPILKIIRNEPQDKHYEYNIADGINVYCNNTFVKSFPRTDFGTQADQLYQAILAGNDRAFAIPSVESFMQRIGCERLKAPSADKTDISMQLHDINTGFSPTCGFSIKSDLGNPPTLLNASRATNFVYEVKGLSSEDICRINAIDTRTKIQDRMEQICKHATDISFVKVADSRFAENLLLIDSRMPELLARALLYSYRDNLISCTQVVQQLQKENPLAFPKPHFYSYKFKKLLCASALGMTPTREWDGIDEANGGYIIVNKQGEVLSYYIYNRNFFESYLLNHTRFERASTQRYEYAELFCEKNRVLLALNLQVRFI